MERPSEVTRQLAQGHVQRRLGAVECWTSSLAALPGWSLIRIWARSLVVAVADRLMGQDQIAGLHSGLLGGRAGSDGIDPDAVVGIHELPRQICPTELVT